MKRKLLLGPGIVLLAMTCFSFVQMNSDLQSRHEARGGKQNLLARYGEFVFQREQCSSCHPLQQDNRAGIISLDGLKGKYSKRWHYIHLNDPTALAANSTMPSYAHLSKAKFSRDLVEAQFGKISSKEWKQITGASQKIQKELGKDQIEAEPNSEIIALIEFLDNIPQSEALKKQMAQPTPVQGGGTTPEEELWVDAEKQISAAIAEKDSPMKGRAIFQAHCSPCHGSSGEGRIGPNLTDKYWLHGGTDTKIMQTILHGVPEKGMMSWRSRLKPVEVGQVIAFIKSIQGSNPANAKESQGQEE